MLNKKIYTVEMINRMILGLIGLICGAFLYFYPGSFYPFLFLGIFSTAFILSGFTNKCFLNYMLKSSGLKSDGEILEQIQKEKKNAEERANFLLNIEAPHEALVLIDRQFAILQFSDGIYKILKRSPQSGLHALTGKNFIDLVHPEDVNSLATVLNDLIGSSEVIVDVRFRILRDDGGEEWVIGGFEPVDIDNRFSIRIKLRIVSGINKFDYENLKLVVYDSLTGLPGRILFTDRIEQNIRHAKRSHNNFAIINIRIDRLREINAEHGIIFGDEVIKRIAYMLNKHVRESDSLCRWDADEFMILLSEVSGVSDLFSIVKNIQSRLMEDAAQKYEHLRISCSFGISLYPDDSIFSEQLLQFARNAAEKSQKNGGDRIIVYRDIKLVPDKSKNDLSSIFSETLKEDLIHMHYQPIYDARTEKLVCVEALARWHDEKMGWVNPAMFINLAENLGLIHELGKKIFDMSFDHFMECMSFDPDLKLSVNVSHRQILSPGFSSDLVKQMSRYGLPPSRIKLEFTESTSMLGSGSAKSTLQTLARMGVTISLDDFGTGYSSISHLKNLPIQEIKIDPFFISNVKTNDGKIIIKSLIDIGHALNLAVVGEGVEDKDTADILRECGIDMMQGNYFRPPQTTVKCFYDVSDEPRR